MAYFEDLSSYGYEETGVRNNTKNVGWLDSAHPFPRGHDSQQILHILRNFCLISVVQMRGTHTCEFCNEGKFSKMQVGDEAYKLGSAEIRVFSPTGEVYAAPNLIYHYVEAHDYLPPEEFIHAMNVGPNPASTEYFSKLQQMQLQFNKTFFSASKAREQRRRWSSNIIAREQSGRTE